MQVDVNVNILFQSMFLFSLIHSTFIDFILFSGGGGGGGEKGEKGKRAEGFRLCYIEIYLIPPKALYISTEVF